MILPRQARDKHKKTLTKTAFPQDEDEPVSVLLADVCCATCARSPTAADLHRVVGTFTAKVRATPSPLT